jgi:hypothetical protein
MAKGDYGKHLYILHIQDAGICKVGRSSNVERRLKEIRSYCPWLEIELAAVFPDKGWIEPTVHGGLKSKRVGREWFKVSQTEAIETTNMFLQCLET